MTLARLRGVVGLLFALAGCPSSPSSTTAASTTEPTTASAAPTTSPTPAPTPTASAAFVAPDAVIAQHVLVAYKGAKNAPKGVTRTKVEAKARAEKVRRDAVAGVSFDELVTSVSDDLATRDQRGSLGKFTRDKMVKPVSDAAFSLRVGEVSDPVETPFGFHVIKRTQ